MEIRGVIAARRAELGLSQSKFGRLIDVEAQTVCAWESGRRKPDHAGLVALVTKAGIDPRALLGTPACDHPSSVEAAA